MHEGVWGHRPVLEGGRVGGGVLAIPILNRKFSHCRIFSPLFVVLGRASALAEEYETLPV